MRTCLRSRPQRGGPALLAFPIPSRRENMASFVRRADPRSPPWHGSLWSTWTTGLHTGGHTHTPCKGIGLARQSLLSVTQKPGSLSPRGWAPQVWGRICLPACPQQLQPPRPVPPRPLGLPGSSASTAMSLLGPWPHSPWASPGSGHYGPLSLPRLALASDSTAMSLLGSRLLQPLLPGPRPLRPWASCPRPLTAMSLPGSLGLYSPWASLGPRPLQPLGLPGSSPD